MRHACLSVNTMTTKKQDTPKELLRKLLAGTRNLKT